MKYQLVLKRILTGLFVLFLALSLLPAVAMPAYAAEPNNKIVVGYYEEPNMLLGAADGEEKSGYSYEYIQKIASIAGWEYEYVYGTWDEIYDLLLSGDVDVVPYVTKTEEREKIILFPELSMGSEQFFLASKDPTMLDNDLTMLSGRTVGLVKGTFHSMLFNSLIEEKGVEVEKVYYDDPQTRTADFNAGKIDFTVESLTTYSSPDFYTVYTIPQVDPFYFAVSMTRPELLEEMNRAQEALSVDKPGYLEELSVKYFKSTPRYKELSMKSQDWLAGHESIRIGAFDKDAPYIIDNGDGTFSGIVVDYVDLMLQELGISKKVDWKIYSGLDELLSALRSGEIDAINPYYNNVYDAEKEGLILSDVIFPISMSIVYQGNYSDSTLSVIATPGQRLGKPYTEEYFPDSKKLYCTNGYECVDAVLSGKATCALFHSDAVTKIVSEYDEGLKTKPLGIGCDLCIATLPENAGLLSIFNKAIPFITEVELNRIEAKHFISEDTSVSLMQLVKQYPFASLSIVCITVALIIGSIAATIKRETDRKHQKELEEALAMAEYANKSKSAFLFSMSHDIRTPLNAIKGYTAMAKKRMDKTDEAYEYLNKIDISGQQLLELINQVLEMSRIESGKIVLEEVPTDIADKSETLGIVTAASADAKGINLRVHSDEITHNKVLIDVSRADQIVTNIVGNAIKYTPEGGSVDCCFEELPCEKQGYGLYRVTVKDTGIGMSEEFQEHIFEEFARENTSTVSHIQGTGLGMPIVKKLVDLMDGTIEIQSKLGQGTTVVVTLPMKWDTDPEKHETKEPVNQNTSFEGKRLLLVEDNEMNREIAKDILEEAGFVVETAEDGDIAVEMLEKVIDSGDYEYYAAVLMDIQMPRMDGYEATRIIRMSNPVEHHIPIIALSANAFEEDRQKSLEAGMDEHIPKPINVQMLKETLARFI